MNNTMEHQNKPCNESYLIKVYVKNSCYSSWDYGTVDNQDVHEKNCTHEDSDTETETSADTKHGNIPPNDETPQDGYSQYIASLKCPKEYRWMNHDLVDIRDTEKPQLVHSPARSAPYLPGVLILEGNRTYGRTKNRKRLLYKCIPDDRFLPHFLIPYDIIMDFSKAHKNKYVLFKFQEWTEEHPHGLLVEMLGDVNHLEAFYEYQLYSKSLHSSVKEMTQRIKEMTKKKTMEEYFDQICSNPLYKIVDKTVETHPPQIFTIDPRNTVDFDDGLSITTCPRTQRTCITVYIAHVVFWLEIFQLWNSFDNRIATIYLPDRRRPMLPSILTESLCSLKEHTKRFALAINFYIDEQTGAIDEASTLIENVCISPYKNYVYEDLKMIHQDVNYIRIFEATVRMDSHIKNSRDIVTYWMVRTNSYMAKFMIQHKTGVFRVGKLVRQISMSSMDSDPDAETVDESKNFEALDMDVRRYIESHARAQSLCYREDIDMEHEVLNKKAYMRITSVIRRYEDVCNECELMRIMGIKLRDGMNLREIYNEDLCNERYHKIRRVESDSEMMRRTIQGEYLLRGIICSRKLREDGRYDYKVYVKGDGVKLNNPCSDPTKTTECDMYSSKDIYIVHVKMREKKELYKEYILRRYVKEKGGGLKIKIEIMDTA